MDLDKFITQFGGVSEEYKFYNGEVTLRYYDKEHAYYLLSPEGDEERQDGVTTVCHIIDKSQALVPWGCKMMQQKLLITVPGAKVGGTVVMTEAEMEDWIAKGKTAHKEKLEEAGNVGSIAHNWIEEYIKLTIAKDVEGRAAHRNNMPSDERAKNACEAALGWMKAHNVRWHLTERKIYSRKYKYAGTMDGLCTCDSCDNPKCCPNPFKDRLTVADWKTSNYLYLEYLFQTAAYQQAYNEEQRHLGRFDSARLATDRWVIRLGKDDGEVEPWHVEAHLFDKHFAGFKQALDLTRTVADIEVDLKARKDDLRAALKAEKDALRAVKAAAEEVAKAERRATREQERLEARTAKDKAKTEAKLAKQQGKTKQIPSEDIDLLVGVLKRP